MIELELKFKREESIHEKSRTRLRIMICVKRIIYKQVLFEFSFLSNLSAITFLQLNYAGYFTAMAFTYFPVNMSVRSCKQRRYLEINRK